ncbi:hypothetical protein DQ238_13155 [Geodermatophilus sp. TF02-6]|uniref:hypothetical protein n=1 Tax=Geodermatophilus sp. TF02-6 TaxID=2250575 RepID=UPI000DEBD7CF|nr:hypothetical protein [Geodermatophilus sp. TF02-6]RBY78144.1 hypothetical protein DQ238_13155 [Geodermatophilus sp. TF02-6]
MVLWPAVSLIGFLALTALVIVMGASTTARYEREQRDADTAPAGPTGRHAAPEPVGVASAA